MSSLQRLLEEVNFEEEGENELSEVRFSQLAPMAVWQLQPNSIVSPSVL